MCVPNNTRVRVDQSFGMWAFARVDVGFRPHDAAEQQRGNG
jgi:hypothetical protein